MRKKTKQILFDTQFFIILGCLIGVVILIFCLYVDMSGWNQGSWDFLVDATKVLGLSFILMVLFCGIGTCIWWLSGYKERRKRRMELQAWIDEQNRQLLADLRQKQES